MKNIYRICGKISLVCYVFLLYQTWHLCRYGGIRRHFLLMFPAALVFLACIVLWLIARRRVRKESPDAGRRKGMLRRCLEEASSTRRFLITERCPGK